MNYSLIRACDIANGPGVRVSLFVSGCTHHCPGCFQPETWNFNAGQPFIWKTQYRIFELLQPDYIEGLTILGGEPLESSNQRDLLPFVEAVRREFPNPFLPEYKSDFQVSKEQDAKKHCPLLPSPLHPLSVWKHSSV